jgi:hypothetical protein
LGDGFLDSEPVIDESLIEKKPWTEDRFEGRIVGPIDFVEKPEATIKVLETRFIKLFGEERNLVACASRREDRVNCNPLSSTLDTQSGVNQEYFHGLTAVR